MVPDNLDIMEKQYLSGLTDAALSVERASIGSWVAGIYAT